MRRSERPKRVKERSHGGTLAEVETHPAYGLVGISRRNGLKKLYGSALDKHGSQISLTVKTSERIHDLHYDRHHGREVLIELSMSHAQFAELITTPNCGDGVPCTLEFVAGRGHLPSIDFETQTEAAKVVDGFRESLSDLSEKLRQKATALDELLEKRTLGKADRKRIRELFGFVRQEVDCNMPFAVEQFQEAAEKVVTQGKAEIDAMVSGTVRKLGLESLEQLASAGSLPALKE